MSLLNYIFGPKLYREYVLGQGSKMYEPTMFLEIWGEKLLSWLSLAYNVGFYTSPLLCTFLYRRGYFVTESISSFAKLSTGIGIIYILSMVMRGLGRSQSPSYIRFIKVLEMSKSYQNDSKRLLNLFDFDFHYWRVDYDAKSEGGEEKKKRVIGRYKPKSFWNATRTPCDFLAYVALHTFGLRLIYPGSLGILQAYVNGPLSDGRATLVEQHRAERNKIRTIDDNDIDTIFIDNRDSKEAKENKHDNGNYLVICSEGNSGFYEVGIVSTPISLRYSVLGWNHPGFAASTGKPYPTQDQNAIDAVMQFAINKLGFPVENIILHGWSIGGYSSIWAAVQYPNVFGLVLDATFDDLLYLALQQMPERLGGVTRIAIRDYCNLHNEELLREFNGPVSMIRRTHDEIIASEQRIETNRGNFLLLGMMKRRFPHIFENRQIGYAKMLLSKPLEPTSSQFTIDNMNKLVAYIEENGKTFPMMIGESYTDEERTNMAEYLIRMHMKDYKSDHCSPLPGEYFSIPSKACF